MKRKRLFALVMVLLITPLIYLGTYYYKPDFVVWYTNVDPSELSSLSVEIAFLDGFESPPIAPKSFCYVDFGTAEDYRRYRNSSRYQDPPDFIVEPRPERPHEYFVKPWDKERLRIMYERIDLAKSRGFYGVILDNAGTIYEYRKERNETSALLVVNALYNVTQYAHSLGLKVVANVASLELLYNVTFLDGVFREDVYFYEGRRVSDEREVERLLEALYWVKDKGLEVFVTEYVTSYRDFEFVLDRLSDFMLFVTDEPYTYDHVPVRYKEPRLYLIVKEIITAVSLSKGMMSVSTTEE